MPSEIDTLMTTDPLSLSDVDIEKIVDYLRASYRVHEQSAKYSNSGNEADKPQIDLVKLGLKKAPVALTRRKI